MKICRPAAFIAENRLSCSCLRAARARFPAFENLDSESKANPSRGGWEDQGYLEQQRSRLPSHKYRRLHLNLPSLPEGSAFSFEKIDAAIERNVRVRPPQPGIDYSAFVDMSGGSNDDSTLAIAHRVPDGRAVLDLVINQGRSTPFDPIAAGFLC